MTTFAMQAVFGVVPGYNHDNEGVNGHAVALVAYRWQLAMEKEYAASDVLVTAVCHPVTVVYPAKFGCPPNGEVAVEVTSVLNPKFETGFTRWQAAALRIIKQVKADLQQERVTVCFIPVPHFHYLEPEG